MKYTAFRIDTRTIKNSKVVDGFFVRGQRSTDCNWPMLSESDSMESAKDAIIAIRSNHQPVYGPDGYEIRI